MVLEMLLPVDDKNCYIVMIITTFKVVIIALFYSNGVVSNFRR